ncbi:MAG: hypothetical protein NTW32_21470 [Chloroflexi bacterium]|nr:hypothetical protein [Chloroflexota bacterium]
MKKNLSILFVVVLGVSLLLAACGGGGGSDGSSVEISNSNPMAACEVYVSPASQNTWGPNQLPAGQQWAPGASIKLSGLASGQYDLKMVACEGGAEGTMQFSVP